VYNLGKYILSNEKTYNDREIVFCFLLNAIKVAEIILYFIENNEAQIKLKQEDMFYLNKLNNLIKKEWLYRRYYYAQTGTEGGSIPLTFEKTCLYFLWITYCKLETAMLYLDQEMLRKYIQEIKIPESIENLVCVKKDFNTLSISELWLNIIRFIKNYRFVQQEIVEVTFYIKLLFYQSIRFICFTKTNEKDQRDFYDHLAFCKIEINKNGEKLKNVSMNYVREMERLFHELISELEWIEAFLKNENGDEVIRTIYYEKDTKNASSNILEVKKRIVLFCQEMHGGLFSEALLKDIEGYIYTESLIPPEIMRYRQEQVTELFSHYDAISKYRPDKISEISNFLNIEGGIIKEITRLISQESACVSKNGDYIKMESLLISVIQRSFDYSKIRLNFKENTVYRFNCFYKSSSCYIDPEIKGFSLYNKIKEIQANSTKIPVIVKLLGGWIIVYQKKYSFYLTFLNAVLDWILLVYKFDYEFLNQVIHGLISKLFLKQFISDTEFKKQIEQKKQNEEQVTKKNKKKRNAEENFLPFFY